MIQAFFLWLSFLTVVLEAAWATAASLSLLFNFCCEMSLRGPEVLTEVELPAAVFEPLATGAIGADAESTC